jgi:hypothetical protein
MEDIVDEIKAKHTEPDDVKLKRLEKKFEPVEKILREGRLPKYNELPGLLKRQVMSSTRQTPRPLTHLAGYLCHRLTL